MALNLQKIVSNNVTFVTDNEFKQTTDNVEIDLINYYNTKNKTQFSQDEFVKISSQEQEVFIVPKTIICYCAHAKEAIDDNDDEDTVFPFKIDTDVLSLIIEYCTHHVLEKDIKNKLSELTDEEKKKQDEEKKKQDEEEKLKREKEEESAKTRGETIKKVEVEEVKKDEPVIFASPITTKEISDIAPKWYADFMNRIVPERDSDGNVDYTLMNKLRLASNYMIIHSLILLICAFIGTRIFDKDASQIAIEFKSIQDKTPKVKRTWAKVKTDYDDYQGVAIE